MIESEGIRTSNRIRKCISALQLFSSIKKYSILKYCHDNITLCAI